MIRSGLILAAGLLLCGCTVGDDDAPGADVARQTAAQACDASWGEQSRQSGGNWDYPLKKWHVIQEGDHWHAWVTNLSGYPAYAVDVPRDGTPPKTCDMSSFHGFWMGMAVPKK